MLTTLFKHWTYRVFAPGAVLRTTYEAFQNLLAFDSQCHEIMADLESLYYQGKKEDFCKISLKYEALAENVDGMVTNLQRMAPGSYMDLRAYFNKFNFYCRFFFAPPELQFGRPFILFFSDQALSTKLAGGKSSTLAALKQQLKLRIPAGYVISTNCFSYLLEYNNLRPSINALLAKTDLASVKLMSEISAEITALIRKAEIPPEIVETISSAQKRLQTGNDNKTRFAVRSSALSEDGQCSFAGQYSSFLNIEADNILEAYIKVLCSKYSPEALSYRINCGLSDEETPMAVMVLSMVDAVTAGVIYTSDPSGAETDKLFIHATTGLGNAVVSGTVIPNVFTVHKNSKQIVTAPHSKQKNLTTAQIQTLSELALRIEDHFGKPQDIEWAMQADGSFIFLQSRELHLYKSERQLPATQPINKELQLFHGGVMASSGFASARAWVPDTKHPLDKIETGHILILHETLPSYVRVLHRVSGVIAELGSAAGHFATVCREFGVPLLLGVGKDISRIKHGDPLSLAADTCTVYSGVHSADTMFIPAYKRDKNLPYFSKLRTVLDFITPLRLVDPKSSDFAPESCRSLHDIIRFSHEMAVQSMFSIGNRCSTIKGGKKRLQTSLPFEVFIVDVDEGIAKSASTRQVITVDMIRSSPFQALWRGFNHPDIIWGDQTYYDWKGYDRMAMSDAFAFQSTSDSASYAVLGKEYLNMNIRFGYHFTVIDALCEPESTTSYCTMRFAGGGGEFEGRELRILFLKAILGRLGFDVQIKGDLLDARISGISADSLIERLESLGKLLGVTKQMDMRLKDEKMVEQQIDKFFRVL